MLRRPSPCPLVTLLRSPRPRRGPSGPRSLRLLHHRGGWSREAGPRQQLKGVARWELSGLCATGIGRWELSVLSSDPLRLRLPPPLRPRSPFPHRPLPWWLRCHSTRRCCSARRQWWDRRCSATPAGTLAGWAGWGRGGVFAEGMCRVACYPGVWECLGEGRVTEVGC